MTLGQMLLVLLAVVLFSTILVSFYFGMITQMEKAVSNIYFSQALKIAEKVFQEYEAKEIGQNMTFDEVFEAVNNAPMVTEEVRGIFYFVDTLSRQCTSSGGVTPPLPADFDHQRLEVRIRIETGSATYLAGTEDHPFTKVLSRNEWGGTP